jgi:hypothetical protein
MEDEDGSWSYLLEVEDKKVALAVFEVGCQLE